METNKNSKASLIVVLCMAALPALAFLGIARINASPAVAGTVPSPAHQVAPHTVTNDLVDLPSALPTQVLPELVVTGQKPWSMPKTSPKKWTCGAPRALVQGPVAQTVRDCEWR